RAVALVDDGLQRVGVAALAGALGDRSLDVVLGHRGVLGLLDGELERRVAVGVSPALLGGHRDRPRELREQLAAAGVDDRLLVLDPGPLGMPSHLAPEFMRRWGSLGRRRAARRAPARSA